MNRLKVLLLILFRVMDLYSTESKRIIALVQDWFNREEQELEATFGATGVVDPTTFLQIARRLRV